MNGKSNGARKGALWLVLAAMAATALFAGGCVAETGDDDDGTVTHSGSADTFVPRLPKDPGGIQGSSSSSSGSVPSSSGSSQPGSTSGTSPGTAPADPDPTPWDQTKSTGTR